MLDKLQHENRTRIYSRPQPNSETLRISAIDRNEGAKASASSQLQNSHPFQDEPRKLSDGRVRSESDGLRVLEHREYSLLR